MKEPPVNIEEEVEWAPGQVWMLWRGENSWPYWDLISSSHLSIM
jgi:hypothetical protein